MKKSIQILNCFLILAVTQINLAYSQQSILPCNPIKSTPWVNPSSGSAVVTDSFNSSGVGAWDGDLGAYYFGSNTPAKSIDANLTNFAQGHIPLGTGSITLRVSDANASNTFSAGNFAGFLIKNPSLVGASLLSTITVKTYLSGVLQETANSGNALIGLNSTLLNGAYEVGFYTTLPYNQIEITIGSGFGILEDYNIYYAINRKFCAGPALSCNAPTALTYVTNSVAIDPVNTGASATSIGSADSVDNALDTISSNYATLTNLVSVAGSVSFAVKDHITTYPANTFTGFDIQNLNILNASLLASATITTYLNGVQQESKTGTSNLASVGLLPSGRQTVGFVTTMSFDEVKISLNQTAVSLGTTRVYGAIFEKFCAGPALYCNAPTALNSRVYPITIDPSNTGAATVSIGSSDSIDNVIDTISTNYATLSNVGSVAGSVSLAVKDHITTYPANTFVGFDIQNLTILNASVLGNISVTTYLNGVQQESKTGTSNLASVGLLSSGRQTVGFVASTSFDEVKISLNQTASVSLGVTRVYGVIFEKLCAGTVTCNNSFYLTNPGFPVTIDGLNTGITSIASVVAYVQNPNNIIDNDTTNFATISLAAGVAATGSIAVKDALTAYPVGSFAGFAIQDVNTLAQATLFNAITVSTYKSGVLQESKSGTNLISLTAIIPIFSTGNGKYTLGFITTMPFDEIQISVGSSTTVIQQINVYGAFIDTRTVTSASLRCMVLNPDFNVTVINVAVSGNTKTNDVVGSNMLYGTPVDSSSNPAGATVSLISNTDGTYTFKTNKAGVYNYNVPVCASGQTSGCNSSLLTITVTDPVVITNPPIVNPDLVVVQSGTSITVHEKMNDGPGNAGGTLGTPAIITSATHGTTSVDGNGNIVYTSTAGYSGQDLINYQVCETPSGKCAAANIYITVIPSITPDPTSAADDYLNTYSGIAVSGNVATNDVDPQGSPQRDSFITTSIAGKGSIVYTAATGAFTFTPVPGFSGPVDFVYVATNAVGSTALATLHLQVYPLVLNPDFNVTNVNVSVSGNISTNDVLPAGTTYTSITPLASNPDGTTIPVLGANGTYTFVSSIAGKFRYAVQACIPGMVSGCLSTTLSIIVKDPSTYTNPPVANPDFFTVLGSPTAPAGTAVNVVANDGVGNTNDTLGTPTITRTPANGTTSVDNSGRIVYTPNAGFYGNDTVLYRVCASPSGLCATSNLIVTVKAPDASNSTVAVDDYISIIQNTVASGNVSANDYDPENNTQTVAAQNITITGKGTFVLNANGTYTFTPVTSFTGPLDLIYTTIDNGTPSASATATVHILVTAPDVLMLQITALLQGPLSGDTMTTTLNQKGLIPLLQPYTGAPFNYSGTEVVGSIPANVTDWVLVELRNGTTPANIIAAKACFMRTDGIIIDTTGGSTLYFNGLKNGNYFVSVRHRNHLGIKTAAPVTLTNSVITPYDFTSAISQAAGTNPMQLQNGHAVMILGNVDYNPNSNGRQVINYSAAVSDVDVIKTFVLNAVGNSTQSPSFTSTAVTNIYNVSDVNLDGLVRYSSAPSDVDLVISNVINNLNNTTHASSFINLVEQLP